jgi:pyruvate ferredoxin oxidoreductase gamma subunit
MIEIKCLGRGGQGAVTMARVLAYAACKEGKFGQSTQDVAGIRRGAEVAGYTRIDDERVSDRGIIFTPDYFVVLDSGLAETLDLDSQLKEGGKIIANSPKNLEFKHKAVCVDATAIAMEYLGVPIINTSMLGAFSAATDLISLESVEKAAKELLLKKQSKEKVEVNMKAIHRAYEEVKKCL